MRLIDADAIVFTHAIARSIDDGHNWNELCVTKDEIDDMPSAEPERKTKIEMNWATYFDNMGTAVIHIPYSYKCGNCGCQLQRTYDGIDINYCPECGYRLEWK